MDFGVLEFVGEGVAGVDRDIVGRNGLILISPCNNSGSASINRRGTKISGVRAYECTFCCNIPMSWYMNKISSFYLLWICHLSVGGNPKDVIPKGKCELGTLCSRQPRASKICRIVRIIRRPVGI